MSFLNEFLVPKELKTVDHGQTIVQLGSCFSEHISERFSQAGFSVLNNPFGVVFHPIPLAKQIIWAIDGYFEEQFIQKEDVFLHFQASSLLYDLSEQSLKDKLQENYLRLKTELKNAHTLFVSLGSAHAYVHETVGVVANCHQQNGKLFQKELSSVTDLVSIWEEVIRKLKNLNPAIQLVFTISPVRYSRDGWIENNRSKARLQEMCEQLKSEVLYFPSYEIVLDLLRDYRYFEKDGVHPNELAIDEVWKSVQAWFLNKSTKKTVLEIEQLKARMNHRLLFPGTSAAIRFEEESKKLLNEFIDRNPTVCL